MLIHKLLFATLFAPVDDLAGGGGGGGDAGGDAGAGGGGEPAGPTMEDTARDAYRAAMGEGTGEDDAGDAGAGDAQGGDQQQKPNGKQRGTDGRFAKAPGEADQTPKPGEQQADQQQQNQAKPHDALPNTWQKDLAETWKTLPENARQQIHKREQEFHNGIRQYKDAAGFGSSIAQEMMPYSKVMKDRGTTPQAVVRDIMGALNTMVTGSEESKLQVFLKMADDYGINLDNLQTQRQRAPAGAAPELTPVLQRMEKLETRISQADQERERRLQQEDDTRVNSFLDDPKNEHARAVSAQMSALLTSGQAKDLQDAYDQAIWLHPDTRAKLLQKQETERREKEQADALKARRATGANVQRRGTPPTPAKAGTMEDTARGVYRKMNGGG